MGGRNELKRVRGDVKPKPRPKKPKPDEGKKVRSQPSKQKVMPADKKGAAKNQPANKKKGGEKKKRATPTTAKKFEIEGAVI